MSPLRRQSSVSRISGSPEALRETWKKKLAPLRRAGKRILLLHLPPVRGSVPLVVDGRLTSVVAAVPLERDEVEVRRVIDGLVGAPPLAVMTRSGKISGRRRRNERRKRRRRVGAPPLSPGNLRRMAALGVALQGVVGRENHPVRVALQSLMIDRIVPRPGPSLVPGPREVPCEDAVRSAAPQITGKMNVLIGTLVRIGFG